MKKILFFTSLLIVQFTIAQVSGNINYKNQVVFTDNSINVNFPSNADIIASVKGLANVKADAYVAIFQVTQTGATTEEVNEIIDKRIGQSLKEIRLKKGVETFVDMITFVPMYDYTVERKLFSRKTYNEIPVGFELKKNIHIKYTDPSLLDDFMKILSANEIYDLVRVDYFSNTLEAVKKDLMNKARLLVLEKVKNYETLLDETFTNAEKKIADGYSITLPVEMYKSYEAYSSSSLSLKKFANVNQAVKSTTLYYQPITNKDFDFVVNSTILEPVIQVQYEIKIAITRTKKPAPKNEKEYILVTPSGDLKPLQLSTSK